MLDLEQLQHRRRRRRRQLPRRSAARAQDAVGRQPCAWARCADGRARTCCSATGDGSCSPTTATNWCYGRRLLALHGEALAHFQAPEFGGSLRVGLPDDYIPALMVPLLATLARLAPRARRGAVRAERRAAAAARRRPARPGHPVGRDRHAGGHRCCAPSAWSGPRRRTSTPRADCLPLALFPEGCIFRKVGARAAG